MEILRINNLGFSYANSNKKVLNNISFSVKEGNFILISGESGCGKSTLLRHLKPELRPYGEFKGEIYYYSKNINSYKEGELASNIGYVLQNPDAQIVTDKVYSELAFGLENLGLESNVIRRKVAEMASFFGIQNLFRKNVNELSGGQKQLLNLASIMVMQPKILILDEPTSQLDPIASKEFIDILNRINKEFSTTIIITEHNLEEVYSLCDKVMIVENGNILTYETPQKVVEILGKNKNHNMYKALPIPCKIYEELKENLIIKDKCTLTAKDCKQWINNNLDNINYNKENNMNLEYSNISNDKNNKAIELKDVYFQYGKGLEPVLRNTSFSIEKGEIYSILGGNGSGKTTTLSLISKQIKHQRGKILINNLDIKKYNNKSLYEENLALLPQNPQSLFVFETLKEDLEEVLRIRNKDEAFIRTEIEKVSELLNIKELLQQHPYDLSGGELQRAGLAKIMLLNPKILLLDEPTKGLDAHHKEEIGNLFLKLNKMGITIVMVTHDIEFSARYSKRCGLFFDGDIVSEGEPREFFLGNNFYTTVASRIGRHIFENVLLYEDVVNLCKINLIKTKSLNL